MTWEQLRKAMPVLKAVSEFFTKKHFDKLELLRADCEFKKISKDMVEMRKSGWNPELIEFKGYDTDGKKST